MSAVRTPSARFSRPLGLSSPLPESVLRGPAAGAELSSAQLLRGGREVVIRHGDQLYRLRHTRNDKLILTK